MDDATAFALSLVEPLTTAWSVYLRIECDENGKGCPGHMIGPDAEARIRAARRLERQGLAMTASYRITDGMEYVIKATGQCKGTASL